MKKIIGIIIMLFSVILGCYIGMWQMFIQPIMYACQMFDVGALTGTIIGVTILKCIFSSFVGIAIIGIGVSIGKVIAKS